MSIIKSMIPGTVKRIRRETIRLIVSPVNWSYCTFNGVNWDNSWTFRGFPHFRKQPGGKIIIGKRFYAVSKMKWNSLGIIQPVLIHAFGTNSRVEIGDDVGVSGCSITAIEHIKIGDRVLIGSGVLITDNDGHAINPTDRHVSKDIATAPVVIEDDTFIGARAIILKGVTLGKGSIVGAGSVVTKSIPPYGIVGGNPARIIGDSRSSKKTALFEKQSAAQPVAITHKEEVQGALKCSTLPVDLSSS